MVFFNRWYPCAVALQEGCLSLGNILSFLFILIKLLHFIVFDFYRVKPNKSEVLEFYYICMDVESKYIVVTVREQVFSSSILN